MSNYSDTLSWRALFSTFDKSNILELADILVKMNWEIVATKGTAAFLSQKGIDALLIDDLIGYSPILEGRVKTLDFRVLGGLLWDRKNSQHNVDAVRWNLLHFDLLVSSFYPFKEMVSSLGHDRKTLIENIDVGGPSMLRAAAKNYSSVIPLISHYDHSQLISDLQSADGSPSGVSITTRRHLAATAFAYLAQYDSIIAAYLEHGDDSGFHDESGPS